MDISISFDYEIDLSQQTLSDLFHDPTATAHRRSRPAIFIRGLNAFLTAHARSQSATVLFTGGNKGVQLTPQHQTQLESNGNARDDLLRALRGFFLSARPGTDQVFVNINAVSSAFFGRQTLDDFLESPAYHRCNDGRKSALLRGLKVQIIATSAALWANAQSSHRFVHEIGHINTICHGNVSIRNCFNTQDIDCTNRIVLIQNPLTQSNHGVRVAHNMLDNLTPMDFEWFPADQLESAGDVPFHNPLNGPQTSAMIEFAREKPQDNYDRIPGHGLRMFGFSGPTPGQFDLQARSGMQAGTQMISINARWLGTPGVRYDNQRANVRLASWNLVGVRFDQRTRKTEELPFINTSSVPSNSDGKVGIKTLLKAVRSALINHTQMLGQTDFFERSTQPGAPSPRSSASKTSTWRLRSKTRSRECLFVWALNTATLPFSSPSRRDTRTYMPPSRGLLS